MTYLMTYLSLVPRPTDSRSLQNLIENLVAISQISWRPLLTLKAGCIGNNGKNWLLNPGTSSQSEGYSSKWRVWGIPADPFPACVVHTINTGYFLVQNPRMYLMAAVFSLTGYLGINFVLVLVRSFGALLAVTGTIMTS